MSAVNRACLHCCDLFLFFENYDPNFFCHSYRQKEWVRIKLLIKEQMDFRSSRLPPGTYANMVNAANTALANQRAIAERNRATQAKLSARGAGTEVEGGGAGGVGEVVVPPEPVVLANQNLQDGES